MKGACYIRVSTDDQIEYSPGAQLKAIMEYASKNNITIDEKHIYYEQGISGKKVDKRPMFLKMIKDAKAKPKPFDCILVHSYDRFARNAKESRIYKELLRDDLKINLISITEDFGNDKNGFLLEGIKDILNEYYSLNLADEVKKGMKEKARRGEIQNCPAFGYKIIDNKLIPVEEEANFIKLIFDLYLNKNFSLRSICRYARNLNVKTKRGNNFDIRGIRYILSNILYTGYLKYNINNEEIIVKGKHEAIIDKEIFEMVQQKLKTNNSKYHHRKHPTRRFSSGLIKCYHCNRPLCINNNSYYICSGYSKGKCNHTSSIRIDTIENEIIEILKNTFRKKIQFKSQNDNLKEYNLIVNKIKNSKKKLIRIKEAYINNIDTLEEYKKNKETIIKELENLNNLKKNFIIANTKHEYEMCLHEIITHPNIDISIKNYICHYIFKSIIFNKEENKLYIEFRR